LELLRFPAIDSNYIRRFVKFEGKEYIDQAMEKNKGLIILGVHFGSWELANAVCATFNHPYRIIIKEQQRFRKLNSLLNSYRQSKEGTIISRGSQTRDIIRSLRKNEIVGIVVDQGGRDGMQIKFFGKNASMHTGALRLALKYGIPVMVAFIIRQQGPYNRIVIRPFHLEKTGNPEADIRNNLQAIIKLTEDVISRYPEQYLWFYKVWKYSDERSIVILSDGKTGHLRQSQAVARIMSSQLNKRGLNPDIKIIKVEFKNNLSKLIVNLYGLFFYRKSFYGSLRFLRYFLEKVSFNDLTRIYADYIISCGASLATINLVLSGETKAKTIVIMRPGMLSFNRFNLAVVPRHDSPPEKKNIIRTEGALNLVDNRYLSEQSAALINRYSFLKINNRKIIGFLIGGETKNYTMNCQDLIRLIERAKDALERLDLDMLLTTSRRTSHKIDTLIKERLEDYPRCRLLIIANENNIPEAVGGILGLSDIVFVSSDSISMVSEAASSGKTVVVFKTGLKTRSRPNLRHQRFLDNLYRQGYIILIDPDQIQEVIEDIIKNNRTTRVLSDNQVIKDMVGRIL
jgi:KDO2-lipid IV(A) lauroyltransferase